MSTHVDVVAFMLVAVVVVVVVVLGVVRGISVHIGKWQR